MGDFTINQKNVITQSGSAEPVIASNVVFPAGHILNVYQTINNTAYSQTTDNWDFIDTGNIAFNGTKILMFGSVTITAIESGTHTVGFRFFDDTTHLTAASGVVYNNWQPVVSSTGFHNHTDLAKNLNGSFLYTHGQSLPYTTNFKIQIKNSTGANGNNYKLNRPQDDDAGNSSVRTSSASSLTLFDIA